MLVWVMEQNKSGLGFYKWMSGKEYIRRTSTFGETVVDDVAYGWNDISVLNDTELNKTNWLPITNFTTTSISYKGLVVIFVVYILEA